MSGHPLDKWLTGKTSDVGRHALLLLMECDGARAKIMGRLREIVRSHYVAPEAAAKRLADLGAPQTAALLREHLPTSKKARSGDLGEILATEIAEYRLAYAVPVRRLRWKDGRDMSLRGDDIVGLARGAKNKLHFLKGESKSRAALATAVLDEAAEALDRDRGRPSRHSVLFVADRLREQGKDDLAKELEEAVLQSFRGCTVEHLIFVLTGSNPESLMSEHLKACAKRRRRRHGVGVRIKDHGEFIDELFEGL
jgi:hypothetical protein